LDQVCVIHRFPFRATPEERQDEGTLGRRRLPSMTLFWLPRFAVPPKSYDSRAPLRRRGVPLFAPAVGVTRTKEATMTNTKTLCKADLMQFTGSEQWYRHALNRAVVFTDGAKHVADAGGAYWLLDEIALSQRYEKAVSAEEFQCWKLTVHDDQTATLLCDDGNGRGVFSKHIEYTDFPLPEITLYFTNKTILLPSEY
jgi:hypothetical protein